MTIIPINETIETNKMSMAPGEAVVVTGLSAMDLFGGCARFGRMESFVREMIDLSRRSPS
jgi:hypothetical protein